MADEARPLSRRERREMEEQAAAGLTSVPVTSSAPQSSQDAGTGVLDASAPSRRDRRRLERLEQPMETWTAVEEMHHTGQVPTMTPEVIAQQEELARGRAAEAQADALRATGETHQVAASRVSPPGISRYDMPDEVPGPPRPAQGGPGDDARRRLAQAAAEAAAQLPSDRERPPAPVRQEHGVIDAPRPLTAEVPALADLTPPSGVRGAQNPFPQGAPAAPPQQGFPGQGAPYPPTGAVPALYPPTGAVPAPSPPTGAVPAPYPPTGAVPAPSLGAPVGQPGAPPEGYPLNQAPLNQAPQSQAPPSQAPLNQAPPSQAPLNQAPQSQAPPSQAPQSQAPPSQAPPSQAPQSQTPQSQTPQSQTPQSQTPQSQAPPSQTPQSRTPQSQAVPLAPGAVVGQVMPGVPQGAIGAPPSPGFGPPTGATPMPGAPSPYPPGTALSPIVTGMLRPVPGATGTMRAIPGAGPMTGTIPRPIIEVQPAGGAKEFGWPHIALLAAAAFVLGLVVWKISGLGG